MAAENEGSILTSIKGPYTVEHNTQNDYITFIPRDHEHKQTLIWLHGLGDTARGFEDLFSDTSLGIVPPTCKIVLPTAPIRMYGGTRMTSWYNKKGRKRYD